MKANKVRMILAGMMAAGMALSAAPAMAEESEVQTEAAAETEIQSEEAATVAEPVSEETYLCGMWGSEHGIAPGWNRLLL